MPKFSRSSLERLASCDTRLQDICYEVIRYTDFTVVCGHRNQATQDRVFAQGLSKVKWPGSKHNTFPSLAVDIAPVKNGKIDWEDRKAFTDLAAQMFAVAAKCKVKLRWGGDFNRDGDKTTNDAWDMPHFELVEQ